VICPRTVLLDYGVCDDEELSHGRSDCDFGCFALGAEALIEVFDGRIEADGRQCCHVKRAAYREPAASDVSLPAPLSAVLVHGCDADEGCDLLFVGDAEFGEFSDEHSSGCGPDAWNGLEQNGFPGERFISFDFSFDAHIALADLALQEDEMLMDRSKRVGIIKAREALLFRGQHVNQLSSPAHLFGKTRLILRGLRGWRRFHRLSEAQDDVGVKRIGFGELSRRTRPSTALQALRINFDPLGRNREPAED
jgi:hypothetical protein